MSNRTLITKCYVGSLVILLADIFTEHWIWVDLDQDFLLRLCIGWLYFSACFLGGLFFIMPMHNKGFKIETTWAGWFVGTCLATFILINLIDSYEWKFTYGNAALMGNLGLGISILLSQSAIKKKQTIKNGC